MAVLEADAAASLLPSCVRTLRIVPALERLARNIGTQFCRGNRSAGAIFATSHGGGVLSS